MNQEDSETEDNFNAVLSAQPSVVRQQIYHLLDNTQRLVSESVSHLKNEVTAMTEAQLLDARTTRDIERLVRGHLELVEDNHLGNTDDPNDDLIESDCPVCTAILEVTETLGGCALLLSAIRTRGAGHAGRRVGTQPKSAGDKQITST